MPTTDVTLPPGRPFPDGFRWGTATASYQVEGAVDEDGRGPSIWDTFVHSSGKMLVDANADVAVDHYHRFREDVALMRDLGTNSYRFSISWPRVFPEGIGSPNTKGIEFYDRLVDELLANGVEPFPTLYHWDLPQALQDRGGWQTRDTSLAFGDYAAYVAEQLSDRVTHFFTINEFHNVVEAGHGAGILAPGLQLAPRELNQVRHHVVLGHGLAVQAIRSSGRPGTQVGPADNVYVVSPIVETEADIRAAQTATREFNAGLMTVMLEGRYTDTFLTDAGADAPVFTDDDMRTIGSPLDFVGINIYQSDHYVRASESPRGFEDVPFAPSHPHAASWHRISPESMYWGPRHLQQIWGVTDIFVTENGCVSTDTPDEHGNVFDSDRVAFTRSYLTQLQRATADGIPVRGYFHWSLLDNFEWIAGYQNRYGLYYVDFATQTRTPKLSAAYYRETIARNAVV